MKHSLLVVVVLLVSVSVSVFAQVDTMSLRILESILRKEQPRGTIVYTDRMENGWITRIKKTLKTRRITGLTSPTEYNTMYLSRREKRHLNSWIQNLSEFVWADSLFENSTRIPVDSFWSHMTTRAQNTYREYMNDTTSSRKKKTSERFFEATNTFQFCPPFGFRNKSIYILYFVRMCGSSCGVEELVAYRLINNEYEKWFLISGSAF